MSGRARRLVGAAGLALALLAAACGGPRPAPRNVLLVSVDTLRPDRLGAYGCPRPTSPNVDRLARQGVLFERVAATSPWTLPSNASLLTGLYPGRHRASTVGARLPDDVPVLPELLREHGLATAGFVSAEFLTQAHGLHRGFDDFEHVEAWTAGSPRAMRNPGRDVTDAALRWLEARGDEPFFLFVHYYDPHSDYQPEARWRRLLTEPYVGPVDGSTAQLLSWRERGELPAPDGLRHLRDLYDAEVAQWDAELGRLLERLDALGRADDTLVVLTADHGEELGEHGSLLHGRTYHEEVIAVPLVLRGPGLPAGRSVAALASLVDVVPTVLGQLGIEPPPGLQGVDLAPAWSGGGAPGERIVFAGANHAFGGDDRLHMARDARYKLVLERGSGRAALFDLAADPRELNERSAELPEVAARLRAALERHLRDERPPELAPPAPEDELERLRRLGYVGDD